MFPILDDLDWTKDKSIQEKAIQFFSKDNTLDFNLLLRTSSKNSLLNIVEVISHKPAEEQYKSIDGLLYLLQDLSWPGSEKALSLLKSFPKEIILPYLEKSLDEAKEENDDNWIANLKILVTFHSFISENFKNLDLMDVLSKAAW